MATSKCPKCESTRFEMQEGAPTGSQYKVMFIQCAFCGTVVGVTDFFNVPFLLDKIGKALGLSVL
jgi:predicted nucleic-acid-binding Zn-ribbon protein